MNKIIGDIMSRNVSVINADISAEEAESELNRLGLTAYLLWTIAESALEY
jgi:hypothetical protein